MVEIGLSSFAYAWAVGVPGFLPAVPLDALGLLDRAAELDVHVVQFADNLPLSTLNPPAIERLRTSAADRDISIEVGARGIDQHALSRYARIAADLDARFVRLVIDRDGDHPGPDEVVTRLAPLEPAFTERGLVLAIENHDRFSAVELARIVGRLGQWTGICLDTANSLGALEDLDTVVGVLGPLTVNVHVKDVVALRADHGMGFRIEGRPAGAGRIDLPRLLSALDGHGRVRTAVLEMWTPPEATLFETLVKEERWVADSVRYLRTVVGYRPAPAAPRAAPAPEHLLPACAH